MSSIGQQYDKVLEAGISIVELYAYALIIEDDRSFGMREKEIKEKINMAVEARCNTCDPLEDIIDRILNGEESFDGDDEEWY